MDDNCRPRLRVLTVTSCTIFHVRAARAARAASAAMLRLSLSPRLLPLSPLPLPLPFAASLRARCRALASYAVLWLEPCGDVCMEESS